MTLRAIDLYSGVGGWSLGLQLAGVQVIRSYEWWQPAIDTYNRNLGRDAESVDIRQLNLDTLPERVDLVVGSPPCTQFSYSNRGGSGDLADGLKDLVRFFEVVERLRPRFWVMENVPRVAKVLEQGFADPQHPLHRFRTLRPVIQVLDMSNYGTPQARRRCIAGVLPWELLHAFSSRLAKRTLGDVVTALAAPVIEDPVWGVQLERGNVTEVEVEAYLNAEETRMNREAKLHHPVYNNMSFPDDLASAARTVTATCTRVSRESIVIEDPNNPGAYRRLSIRERACLQGFPITYQFFGRSFSEKAKMVGNAIPPAFTYLVACAAQGVQPKDLRLHSSFGGSFSVPPDRPAVTRADQEGRTYPVVRRFRAALRGLRFKSGMRFELANAFEKEGATWRVSFYFGPSHDVRQAELDFDLMRELQDSPFIKGLLNSHARAFADLERRLWETGPESLQRAWTRRGEGMGPYELADALAGLAELLHERFGKAPTDVRHAASEFVLATAKEDGIGEGVPGSRKLADNALAILSGMIVGSWFNCLHWHGRQRAAA